MNYVPNNDDSECESGNEVHPGPTSIGNPPGLQSAETWDTRLPATTVDEARRAGLLDPPPWEQRP